MARPDVRRYLISFILVLALIAGVLIVGLAMRNPLTSLPKSEADLTVDPFTPVKRNGRLLEHVVLSSGTLGKIGIFVNLPDPLPSKKLPILMILGGLGSGEASVRMIQDIGNNAIVGYDWPIPLPLPEGRALIQTIPDLYQHVMVIPGQVASSIGWLAKQPWADAKRVSVLGFSLGALATPAVDNLSQAAGYPVGWSIIAYGGAPLGEVFAANPHIKPAWLRLGFGPVIDLLLRPLEPSLNLQNVTGHFLVLEGRNDGLMPEATRDALRDAVPNPKDVIVFSGEHMGVGVDKKDLLEEIIRTSRKWLIDNGACNPPGQNDKN